MTAERIEIRKVISVPSDMSALGRQPGAWKLFRGEKRVVPSDMGKMGQKPGAWALFGRNPEEQRNS